MKNRKVLMTALLLICLANLFMPAVLAEEPNTVTLTVQQILTSRWGCVVPEDTFSYRLTPELETNPMPVGSTEEGFVFDITGTGSVDIGPITYTHVGIYSYELQLITDDLPDYTYDEGVYTLEVYVDKWLNVVAAVAYNKNGEKVSEIEFEHIYDMLPSDPEIMVDPPVMKVISGNPTKESVFTFQLKADDPSFPMPEGSDNGVKTITITGSGQKEFGTWSYYEAGTYSYTISEINTGEAGYTYDTTIYTITDVVTVVNGQLILETRLVSGDMGEVPAMTFTNVYRAGGGPWTGDDSRIMLYIILLCVSATAVAAYLIHQASIKRRNGTTDPEQIESIPS